MRFFLVALLTGGLLFLVGCGGDNSSSPANAEGQNSEQEELLNTLNGENTQPSAAASGTTSQEVQQELMTQTARDTIQGKIRQVGSAPLIRTVLQPDNEEEDALQLKGPKANELGRLVGAVVEVTGNIEPGGTGQKITVQQYEILSIGGQKPIVGQLNQQENGQYVLATGPEQEDLVGLGGVSEQLAQNVGQKIWVVVDDEGGVQRFGVLQLPTETASGAQ